MKLQGMKSILFAALDKIGKTNGHNVPQSQDPLVALQHEYMITTDAEAYFKKRREKAKGLLIEAIGEEAQSRVDKTVATAKKLEVGDTCTVNETDKYTTVLDVKAGASFLDVAKLKVTLLRDHKMNSTEVEALIEACTSRREPSQSWKIVERS